MDLAPVIACGECGAPLPVNPALDEVECLACATKSAVPAEVKTRAQKYVDAVGLERAAEERAELMTMTFEDDAKKDPAFVVWTLVFATLTAFWILGGFLVQLFLSIWIDLLLYALTATAMKKVIQMFIHEIAYTPRPPPKLGAQRKQLARCGECGGRVPFHSFESTAKCPFCGATTQINDEVAAEAKKDADENRARAEAKKEKAGQAWTRAMSRIEFWGPAIVFFFVLAGGSVILWLAIEHPSRQEIDPKLALAAILLSYVSGIVWAIVDRKVAVRRAQAARRAA